KLRFYVCCLVLRVGNRLAVLPLELWILDGHCLVHCRVSGNVRRIVCQRAQSEGIFVDISALQQQLVNEVSATNVVHQVAELLVTERVITQVLDDGASVGVGMRFFDLIFRETGISLEQQGADLVGPEQVYDFLVGQNRVSERRAAAHHHDEKKRHYALSQRAPKGGCGRERRGSRHGASHTRSVHGFVNLPGDLRQSPEPVWL